VLGVTTILVNPELSEWASIFAQSVQSLAIAYGHFSTRDRWETDLLRDPVLRAMGFLVDVEEAAGSSHGGMEFRRNQKWMHYRDSQTIKWH